MEKMFTAKSYRHLEQVSAPFIENGKKYVNVKVPCVRCGGTGFYGHFGVCYKCKGKGASIKTVRLYTEAELNQMEIAAARKKEKIEKELLDNSEKNKKEWFKRNGFSEEGFIWCVSGEDTYSIKDFLKENGFRFNSILKWYGAKESALPEGYSLVKIDFNDIAIWDPFQKIAEFKLEAKDFVEEAIATKMPIPEEGDFIGEIGERLKKLPAKLKTIRGFDSRYGYTYVYTFSLDNSSIVWFTSKNLQLTVGSQVILTGTVKKHEFYKGVKLTHCNRCVIETCEEKSDV